MLSCVPQSAVTPVYAYISTTLYLPHSLPSQQKSHNETVSKLSFVLALVECIIDLAQSRSSPLSESVTEKVLSSSPGGGAAALDHISFMSEGDRCIEQLVLYVRALQLLSSSIQLAKDEVSAGRLHPSNNVRARELADRFICLLSGWQFSSVLWKCNTPYLQFIWFSLHIGSRV